MTTAGVTVEGTEELARTLDAAAKHIEHPEAAQQAAGRLLATRGRSNAPVATGALANSIQAAVEGDTVNVGSPLDYAAVTEYGGGNNIPSQPFLRPALQDSEAAIAALYLADAQAALNHVKGA